MPNEITARVAITFKGSSQSGPNAPFTLEAQLNEGFDRPFWQLTGQTRVIHRNVSKVRPDEFETILRDGILLLLWPWLAQDKELKSLLSKRGQFLEVRAESADAHLWRTFRQLCDDLSANVVCSDFSSIRTQKIPNLEILFSSF